MAGLKEKVADLGNQVAGKVHDTVESVRSTATEKMSRASETLSDTYQSSRDTAAGTVQQVSGQVTDAYAHTRDSVADVIERYPVAVGGIAFAVGSLVAAAVPVSRQENRLLGETSEEIKRRGSDLAFQGMHEAESVVRRVVRTATDEVRNRGLTPEAARNTARAAVDTTREAVEQTVSGGRQPPGR